jgi:hypothetical protein
MRPQLLAACLALSFALSLAQTVEVAVDGTAAAACDCAVLQNEVTVQSNRVQAIIQECNGKLVEAQVMSCVVQYNYF